MVVGGSDDIKNYSDASAFGDIVRNVKIEENCFKLIMQKIEELLHASIVQKVCKELENHIGINDETLAEFIINLKKQSTNLKQFEQNLSSNSADFDITLVQSLWRMIEAMAPRQSTSTSNSSPTTKGTDSSRTQQRDAIWKSYVKPYHLCIRTH